MDTESSIAEDPSITRAYAVGRPLGSGSFGEIFQARQITTGQEVAIKVLRLDLREGAPPAEEQIERFSRETRICAELHHTNIVPLIDSGVTRAGQVYAVFARVPGSSLEEVLAAEGALEPAEALHFMMQVIDAVGCAHALGIVHRDLKPANVMINATGARRNALVLDFGLGALAGPHEGVGRLTQAGEYLGTPLYSAPEQLRGALPSPRNDLYAWGLVFLECLTGEPVMASPTVHEIIHRHLSPDPVAIPETLRRHELGRLLELATRKEVERREVSAVEILAGLQRCDPARLPSRGALSAARRQPAERWSGAAPGLSRIWLVPHARNPNFADRETELRRTAELLGESRGPATVALHGLAGVGKSQLALEHAYRHGESYDLVAWVRAGEPESLALDYCAIGTPLELPGERDLRQRAEAVQAWLERHDRWLLIFDSAPQPEAIRPYLPRAHAGHILVTSRHASWRALARSVPVEVLPSDEAVQYLLRRCGDVDEASAAALAEQLGCLPLALEEAAAYIEATGRSIAGYLPLLQRQKLAALGGVEGAGIVVTWELSFRQIERQHPEAVALLSLCAHLASDDIPLDLFLRGREGLPPEWRKCLGEEVALDACMAFLRSFSLVTTAGGAISIHRLVQRAARERLSEADRRSWAAAAVQVVEAAYPHSTFAGPYEPESKRLLPHALAALGHAAPHQQSPGVAGRLLQRTAIHRSVRGRNDLACEDLEAALALLEREEPRDEARIAAVLWELGMVRFALGDPEAAVGHLESSLGLNERRGGPSQLWVARDLLALAWVRRGLGDARGALASAEGCLAITEQNLGPLHALNAMSLSVMARCHWALGSLPEARRCVERGLEALEGETQEPHPFASASWNNLAQVQLDLGQLDAARRSVDRSLEIGARAWGTDHPFMIIGTCLHGSVLLRAGELGAAREPLEAALTAGARACRRLHEDIAVARVELGELHRLRGDFEASRLHLEHALKNASLICGDRTRFEGLAHFATARLHQDVGDLDRARHHCETGLDIVRGRLGDAHPEAVPGLRILAGLLREQGDPEGAEGAQREARRLTGAAGLVGT